MPVNARRSIFILLNLASLLSLLLCVGSITWWARSYAPHQSAGEADSLDFTKHDPLYWMISNPGKLTFCRQVGHDWQDPWRKFNVAGVDFDASKPGPSTLCNLSIPYWMVTTITLLLPMLATGIWLKRWARRRRRAHGLCTACGYDLRATPGRCPECGAVPVVVASDRA
jgi:hypothetical protein